MLQTPQHHQGYFADQLFRMFFNMRATCYSLKPPPPVFSRGGWDGYLVLSWSMISLNSLRLQFGL